MEWNIKIDRRGKSPKKKETDIKTKNDRKSEMEISKRKKRKKNNKRMKRETETERCSKSDFLDDATTTLA